MFNKPFDCIRLYYVEHFESEVFLLDFYFSFYNSYNLYSYLLKNIEFGEMNKHILQFLNDLLRKLITEQTDQRFQEIFLKISAINKLSQLRNALK